MDSNTKNAIIIAAIFALVMLAYWWRSSGQDVVVVDVPPVTVEPAPEAPAQ